MKQLITIIKGKKQQEEQEECKNYILSECRSASFSRVISLPEDADLEHVKEL